jgi:V/A-type H+-transporting ATPase subunit C
MAGEYDYGNARLRAMKSRLLDRLVYEELLNTATFDELISALARTPYRPDVETALMRYGGARCIAEAVRLNVARECGQIRSFFDGEPRRLIGVLLGRWDVFNLKTILRGHARGIPTDQIVESLVPAGDLDAPALAALAAQPTVRATVDLLVTWRLPYARPLVEAMPAYTRRGDLAELELALDRDRFAAALAGLPVHDGNAALVREILVAEIDATNIMTLLRLSRVYDREAALRAHYGTTDLTPLLLPGGLLTAEQMSHLADGRWHMADSRWQIRDCRFESRIPNLESVSGDLVLIQRALERWLILKGVSMFGRDPLGIAVAIGYLSAKQAEVANLRLIAYGKSLNLEPDAIRRELIEWQS